ncbi:MAG: Hsp70 family protein [Desulfobacterales bacterium]
MAAIVGIDLGTTYSEVAVLRDGQAEVVAVDGEPIMPSCVGLDNQGALIVGRVARNQMALAPENTILSIKRKMGKNEPVALGDRHFSPEEVSALILRKLKQAAEAHLGEAVTQAVITVPAYFDDAQRKATQNAGQLAGLEVLRIINEPTAAALAYDAGLEEDQTILVYDLGGGTFDVSLVVVEKGVVEVKASHGDTALGGDDFDNLLIAHAAEAFREENKVDLLQEPRVRNRLWSAVEAAKRKLSDAPFARIREEYLWQELHLDLEIARFDYEELIRPLVRKTMDCVHHCLRDASMLPGAVDRVILVGGASRTPLISETIRQEMRREPTYEINPELIVAMGAAIQAGVLAGQPTRSVLVDITPYTFGTQALSFHGGEIREDTFVPIIRRSTPLPVSKAEVFTTAVDEQRAVDVRIYQGEEPSVEDNIFIGNFLIEGLSKVPAGNQIVLNLALDLNGVLNVTALEKRTGLSKSVRMTTGGQGPEFDLQAARRNLAELGDDEWSADVPADPAPADRQALLARAKDLRRRAHLLLAGIEETDAGELRLLLQQVQDAIAGGDYTKLADVLTSLDDMLFYLED